MGRYLAMGIPERINIIRKRNQTVKPKEALEDILKSLNKYINTNDYDISLYNNAIILSLKEEIFNDNIHSLVDELSSDFHIKDYLYYSLDIDKNVEFNPDSFKLKLELEDDDENEERVLKTNDDSFIMDEVDWFSNQWLLTETSYINNFTVYLYNINLWTSYDKVITEDDFEILWYLNSYKKKDYKNLLGKNLITYISG